MKLLFLLLSCAICTANAIQPLNCNIRNNITFTPVDREIKICDFKEVIFDRKNKLVFNESTIDMEFEPLRIRFLDSYLPEIPSELFDTFRKVEVLEITHADLKFLFPRSLHRAEQLISFKANNNKIQRVPHLMFKDTPKLQFLDLSSNSISHVNGGAFSGLENLKELGLSFNQIDILDEDTFKPLTNLTWIWLDHNKLRIISANLLMQSSKLKGIYLNDNKISALSPVLFDHLPELRFLYLAGNNCTNRNYLSHTIPNNSNIKKDLVKCYQEYRTVIPDEEENFKEKNILDKSEKAVAACESEKVSLLGRLETALQQLGNKQKNGK
ncbi:CLUMA_CG005263, isoform A [Clunio marinus]|uniref:CLUMA_CG005263, isoform A n=1 Tax=Clunio marinus TaxID=568069 RepID=A0A1J1HZP8_9DIPT|nr:CLUMA_CG005263, isoform A [Clunio marinus]